MIINNFIAEQEQTCGACPEQYEGKLVDGQNFYLRFRWGVAELGIGPDLDAAVDDTRRGGSGVEVVVDSDGLRGMFDSQEELDATFAALLRQHPRRPIVKVVDAPVSFRIRFAKLGGHVHAKVWSSEFGPDTTHGLNGTLVFREVEWQAFRDLLTAADARLDHFGYDGVVVEFIEDATTTDSPLDPGGEPR